MIHFIEFRNLIQSKSFLLIMVTPFRSTAAKKFGEILIRKHEENEERKKRKLENEAQQKRVSKRVELYPGFKTGRAFPGFKTGRAFPGFKTGRALSGFQNGSSFIRVSKRVSF